MPTDKEPADEPVLAKWWFIHPEKVQLFVDKLHASISSSSSSAEASSVKRGKTGTFTACLKPENEKFQKVFQELQKQHGEDFFFILHQRHGELVEVAPGWAHAVSNQYPNVKIAWDICKFTNLCLYVESWMRHSDLGLKITGDYALLERHIVELAHHAYVKKLIDMN